MKGKKKREWKEVKKKVLTGREVKVDRNLKDPVIGSPAHYH